LSAYPIDNVGVIP